MGAGGVVCCGRCYSCSLTEGCRHIKSQDLTYRVVDVIKALAGWEAVVGIDVFESTDCQEHSDGRSKGEECLRVKSQLWVINGYLWRNSEAFSHFLEIYDLNFSCSRKTHVQ